MGLSAINGIADKSGTIAVGGTAQDAVGANTGRQYLLVQNLDGAADLWVNFGANAAVATAGSILLKAGGSITFEDRVVPSGRVSVVGATTGHKFTCKEG